MPKLAIISLSERNVTRTGSGRTRLTFTIQQPAQDEIGGARQAERSLHEAGRESMERLLALYDTISTRNPVDGIRAFLPISAINGMTLTASPLSRTMRIWPARGGGSRIISAVED